MERDLAFLKEKYIAHRGLHDKSIGILENTMDAFSKALENGYPIELDVHILKDNSVIVFHDNDLNRMANIDKKIKDMTYNEIKQIKLIDGKSTIPLLTDVLKLVDGKVPILIELKYDVKIGLLEDEVMNILKDYKAKYAIHSFRVRSILYLKKHYPFVLRGQLVSNIHGGRRHVITGFYSKHMLFNFLTKPDFISFDVRLLPDRKIKKLKNKKLILGWTVRSEKSLEKSLKYCDNVIVEKIL